MIDVHEDANRVKITSLDCRLLVDVLNWFRNPIGWLALPIMPELPEDVRVVSIRANWECRTIDALVSHPSFDYVPPGTFPPRIPGLITEFRVVPIAELIEKAAKIQAIEGDDVELAKPGE